jgi:hypothetical protein
MNPGWGGFGPTGFAGNVGPEGYGPASGNSSGQGINGIGVSPGMAPGYGGFGNSGFGPSAALGWGAGGNGPGANGEASPY